MEHAAENDGAALAAPEPPKRSLILPANTSASAFNKGLSDRGGRAVLVETEIDTLVNDLGQEWGKFDDTLRKAFHHERVSYLRNAEEVCIEHPQLSTVLSGTIYQFERLVQSTENGLFSRFAVFVFQGDTRRISQSPSGKAREKTQSFQMFAEEVETLFHQLRRRKNPLHFSLTPAQWELHDRAFTELKYELYANDPEAPGRCRSPRGGDCLPDSHDTSADSRDLRGRLCEGRGSLTARVHYSQFCDRNVWVCLWTSGDGCDNSWLPSVDRRGGVGIGIAHAISL